VKIGLAIALVGALLGAGGGGGAASDHPAGAVLKLRSSSYGKVLFDGNDRALYHFTRDPGGRSRCYGDCAEAWPPFLTDGEPRAGRGTRDGLLGTIRRRSGKRQVTYNGRPLYYYIADRKPGQILCQDVREFGGSWYVVSARGAAVR